MHRFIHRLWITNDFSFPLRNKIFFILPTLALILALPTFTHAQTFDAAESVNKLNMYYDTIISATDSVECIEYDPKTPDCLKTDTVVNYLYNTFNAVEQTDEPALRTVNSQTWLTDSGRTVKIFSSPVMTLDHGTWYWLDSGKVLKSDFDLLEETKLIGKAKIWDYFLGHWVLAQTYYPAAGDGDVTNRRLDAIKDWDTTHDALSGSSADYTAVTDYAYVGFADSGGQQRTYIRRGFLPFDTSSIDDSAVISSSSVHIYVTTKWDADDDGEDFIMISDGTQASGLELVTDDYDEYGTDDFSNGVDIGDISTNQYLTFILNAAGESNISKTGYTQFAITEGHDYDDTAYAGANDSYNGIGFSAGEQTGTNQDPFLLIDLEEEEEATTSTSTVVNASCEPDAFNELGFITACSFASSTGVTYTNYHIPFFVWFVFGILILFIFDRIIIESLIRLRKL